MRDEMTDMDQIFLKEWRLAACLTLAELGKLMRLSEAQISRVERGKRRFTGRYLLAFKHTINRRLDEIDAPTPRIRHIADALCLAPSFTALARFAGIALHHATPDTIERLRRLT